MVAFYYCVYLALWFLHHPGIKISTSLKQPQSNGFLLHYTALLAKAENWHAPQPFPFYNPDAAFGTQSSGDPTNLHYSITCFCSHLLFCPIQIPQSAILILFVNTRGLIKNPAKFNFLSLLFSFFISASGPQIIAKENAGTWPTRLTTYSC